MGVRDDQEITLDLLVALKDKEFRDHFLWQALGPMISRQMRNIRISRGMTNAQLATAMGVSQGRVSYWENEKNGAKLSLRTLFKFAKFFDVALIIRFCSWGDFLKWVAAEQSAPSSFNSDELMALVKKDVRNA